MRSVFSFQGQEIGYYKELEKLEKFPKPLKRVADNLARLPGLGPRSGLRIALSLLNMPREEVEELAQSVLDLRSSLFICERCGALSDESPCGICKDPDRDPGVICVVADLDSLLVIEQAGIYRGRYLVLGGLMAPLEGINSPQLHLERLKNILKEGEVREIILALGATKESEMTENLLREILSKEYPSIVLTRLAQGIPVGVELKYVDKETLKQSLAYRQNLK